MKSFNRAEQGPGQQSRLEVLNGLPKALVRTLMLGLIFGCTPDYKAQTAPPAGEHKSPDYGERPPAEHLINILTYGKWERVHEIDDSDIREIKDGIKEFPVDEFLQALQQESDIPLSEIQGEFHELAEIRICTNTSLDAVIQDSDVSSEEKGYAQFAKTVPATHVARPDGKTVIFLNGGRLKEAAKKHGKDLASVVEQSLVHEYIHAIHHRGGGITRNMGIAEALTHSLTNRLLKRKDLPFREHGPMYDEQEIFGFVVIGDLMYAIGHEKGVLVEKSFLKDRYNDMLERLVGADGRRKLKTLDSRILQAPPDVLKGPYEATMIMTRLLYALSDQERDRVLAEMNQASEYSIAYGQNKDKLALLIRDPQRVIRRGMASAARGPGLDLYVMSDLFQESRNYPMSEQQLVYRALAAPERWQQYDDQQLIKSLLKQR